MASIKELYRIHCIESAMNNVSSLLNICTRQHVERCHGNRIERRHVAFLSVHLDDRSEHTLCSKAFLIYCWDQSLDLAGALGDIFMAGGWALAPEKRQVFSPRSGRV